MTYDEAFEVVFILQANYSNFYSKQTAEQAEIMTQLWATVFKDYEKNIVTNALMVVILRKKEFPPSVGEINEEIIKMTKPYAELLDGEMAWGKAQSLIKHYGTYLDDEQKQRLNTQLSKDEALKMTIRACGGLEGLRMCEMDNLNTLRAQFIRIYNSYAKRRQDDLMLPDNLKCEINRIQQESIEKSKDMVRMLADKLSMTNAI